VSKSRSSSLDVHKEVDERGAVQRRVPRWLVRILSDLGFAAFFAIQIRGLWNAKPNLANTIFTSVYLLVVFGMATAIDRALAEKAPPR
jgi:hypothetical protein